MSIGCRRRPRNPAAAGIGEDHGANRDAHTNVARHLPRGSGCAHATVISRAGVNSAVVSPLAMI
jgi:hypothetical protein